MIYRHIASLDLWAHDYLPSFLYSFFPSSHYSTRIVGEACCWPRQISFTFSNDMWRGGVRDKVIEGTQGMAKRGERERERERGRRKHIGWNSLHLHSRAPKTKVNNYFNSAFELHSMCRVGAISFRWSPRRQLYNWKCTTVSSALPRLCLSGPEL